ncbi:MAG: bifunctional diaminohydroxyphosphoribosylaminopyrimidine deaminase/5-amino-6-(5-phosphoribosylamino)uracil reductase RibD [Deltaproteobacteria bacterium]|nr:bifunctional diaminohydroxyphosphoribosylaminopyrimidine deaminase/5-amino-6-(5-phosphoribosylamino)uracil reductase RibD [Deltaproteobacteria bacterium]
MDTPTHDDARWMQLAIAQGLRGDRRVRPNPRVGCVLVQGDRLVGAGYHAQVGGPHAEVGALQQAGAAARGATAYVTLEPCNHHGRTPPCSHALLEAGVARVVVGVADPHPKAQGGAAWLRERGVAVEVGVLAAECRELAEVFLCNTERGRAFVQLKVAATLDGRMAAQDGSSQWITGPAARQAVHRERAQSDAILIGSGTALADDPRLDVRLDVRLPDAPAGPLPLRVVLDRRARLANSAQPLQIFDTRAQPTLIYTLHAAQLRERCGPGVEVADWPGEGTQLSDILVDLLRRGRCHALCEAGPTLATALLRQGAVDRLDWWLAPKLLGSGRSAVEDLGIPTITECSRWQFAPPQQHGADILLVARPTGAAR